MSIARFLIVLFTLSFAMPGIGDAKPSDYPELMLILDGSGSMWGQAGGEVKIESARKAIARIVPALPPEVKIGLTSYGHNRKGDCNDIEVLIPPGSADRTKLINKVNRINPKGKTPIAGSLQMVTDLLKLKENETTIVLVSDGEETCQPDPCGAVKTMQSAGIKFILHVIGFDVNAAQEEELRCLAEAGGGNYFEAKNSNALLSSLKQVQKTVETKVETAKATSKKTASGLGKLRITIPEKGLVSLNALKIIRTKDGKALKTIAKPKAQSMHPLPGGEYELIAGFANANYAPDSEVSFGMWTVNGGQTTDINLGVMLINIADSLKEMAAGAVVITNPEVPEFYLSIPYKDNDYYLYKPKPLPEGVYRLSVHYKRSYLYKTPEDIVTLAENITIPAGREGVVTLNSGIRLAKPQSDGLNGFELISVEDAWGPMKILAASNGDYPLWQVYGAPPGTYRLNVLLEGMDEPLTVSEEVPIKAGELIEYDTGL